LFDAFPFAIKTTEKKRQEANRNQTYIKERRESKSILSPSTDLGLEPSTTFRRWCSQFNYKLNDAALFRSNVSDRKVMGGVWKQLMVVFVKEEEHGRRWREWKWEEERFVVVRAW
jgi:hypothetical protein